MSGRHFAPRMRQVSRLAHELAGSTAVGANDFTATNDVISGLLSILVFGVRSIMGMVMIGCASVAGPLLALEQSSAVSRRARPGYPPQHVGGRMDAVQVDSVGCRNVSSDK